MVGKRVVQSISDTYADCKPKERRPITSLLVECGKRAAVNETLGWKEGKNDISKYEWTQARAHASLYGPGAPLPKEDNFGI